MPSMLGIYDAPHRVLQEWTQRVPQVQAQAEAMPHLQAMLCQYPKHCPGEDDEANSVSLHLPEARMHGEDNSRNQGTARAAVLLQSTLLSTQ